MIDRHEFSEAWLDVATRGGFDLSNPFLRFVAAWMAFNALYGDDSAQGGEWGRIERYAAENRLNDHHNTLMAYSGYSNAVQTLAEGGVSDDRTGKQRMIASVGDVLQVLRCVYQVRCNLLHGGKHPTNPRDRDLCHASYVITATLLVRQNSGKVLRDAC